MSFCRGANLPIWVGGLLLSGAPPPQYPTLSPILTPQPFRFPYLSRHQQLPFLGLPQLHHVGDGIDGWGKREKAQQKPHSKPDRAHAKLAIRCAPACMRVCVCRETRERRVEAWIFNTTLGDWRGILPPSATGPLRAAGNVHA